MAILRQCGYKSEDIIFLLYDVSNHEELVDQLMKQVVNAPIPENISVHE